MFIIDAIKNQIERLQEVSVENDYQGVFPIDAVETEISLSKELRELIELHNKLINEKEEYESFEKELEESYK